MFDYFVKCQLVSLRKIHVVFFAQVILPNDLYFYLYVDGVKEDKLRIVRRTSNLNLYFFELELTNDFPFGRQVNLRIPELPLQIVDNSNAVFFKEFEELFSCPNEVLGNVYDKNETTFRVWAPLASSVQLKIKKYNDFSYFKMNRLHKGVYEITLKGDFEEALYGYEITNNGVTRFAKDIYARGTSLNSEYSAVVDLNKVTSIEKKIPSNKISNLLDCVIYETNIRDFTEDKHTNIVNKGKYLGFIEENRTTKKGKPAGFDYLKLLGFTHVQLNPILDFRGVDDVCVDKSYNWGYDPISWFAIEGSYSCEPHIPIKRMIEFKQLVEKMHDHDMRVVVDVVYNHVYEYIDSDLEKTVPNYYFRRRKDGFISQASGCGNDIASERSMVRKLIVESALNLVTLYNIDGFRFDLMGLIDIGTIKELTQKCLSVKKDIVFYGEGWNMDTPIPNEDKAACDNAFKIPEIGFFNDVYRDIVKGPTFKDKIHEKGYINGNVDYRFGMNYVFHGSVINNSYQPRFSFAHQSINYIECHDNNTLFDKLMLSNSNEDETIILRRIRLANALTIVSFGTPFIHMGQEIGLSKFGLDNTYNQTVVNNMNWDRVDENFDMVMALKLAIQARKDCLLYTRLDNPNDIKDVFQTIYCDNNLLALYCDKKQYLKHYVKLLILVNPTESNQVFETDEYYSSLPVNNEYSVYSKRNVIPPASITILYKI